MIMKMEFGEVVSLGAFGTGLSLSEVCHHVPMPYPSTPPKLRISTLVLYRKYLEYLDDSLVLRVSGQVI
jgi:hypothetical protein